MFGFNRRKKEGVGKAIYTVEEYLEIDDSSETPYELNHGIISEVNNIGLKENHANTYFEKWLINLKKNLSEQIDDKIYELLSNFPDRKTKVLFENDEYVFYPDFLIVDRQKAEFYENRKDIIINPLVVVEVSSIFAMIENSEKNDRSFLTDRTWKLWKYQSLSSLKEYILITDDGNKIIVETYDRLDEKNWKYQCFSKNTSKTITFELIGVTFPMTDFYL